jgi:hypothetical protein
MKVRFLIDQTSHNVGDALFAAYQFRFKYWEIKELPGCDEGLRDILPTLNRRDDIATVFCCESHPENNDRHFYVMFVVRENGREKLFEFYRDLIAQSGDFKITLDYNYAACGVEGFSDLIIPNFCIRNMFTSPKTKMNFLQKFKEVAKQHFS